MRLRASSSGFARNDAHPHADARAQVTSDNQYKFLMAYMWISVMIIGLVLGLLIGNAHEAFEAGLTEAVEQARGGVEDALVHRPVVAGVVEGPLGRRPCGASLTSPLK